MIIYPAPQQYASATIRVEPTLDTDGYEYEIPATQVTLESESGDWWPSRRFILDLGEGSFTATRLPSKRSEIKSILDNYGAFDGDLDPASETMDELINELLEAIK